MSTRDRLQPVVKPAPMRCLSSGSRPVVGLGNTTANAIRRGAYVPHFRYWAQLRSAMETHNATPVNEWESLPPSFYWREIAPFLHNLTGDQITRATDCRSPTAAEFVAGITYRIADIGYA